VAVPCFDKKVFVPCVQGLMNAVQVFLSNGIPFDVRFEVGMPYVNMARNNLVRSFMESECTDLVFIDADLGFPPAAFRDLIVSNEAVVGGAYPQKNTDGSLSFAILLKTDGTDHPIVKNGLLEAEGLPTGFLKIKRQVIQQLMDAHPELAYLDPPSGKITYDLFGMHVTDGRFYGDDYAFCKRWRDLGGQCWVIPDMTFIHCGSRNFEGNLQDLLLANAEKETPATPAPVTTEAEAAK
jgi:hypothetical protein